MLQGIVRPCHQLPDGASQQDEKIHQCKTLTPRIGHHICPQLALPSPPAPTPTLRPWLPLALRPASRVVTMEALLQVGDHLPRSLLIGRRQQTHRQSGTPSSAQASQPSHSHSLPKKSQKMTQNPLETLRSWRPAGAYLWQAHPAYVLANDCFHSQIPD